MTYRVRLPQAAAVGVAIVALTTAVLGTPGMYRRISEPCPASLCEPFERLTAPSVRVLTALGVPVGGWTLFITALSWALLVLALTVALVLVWRRSTLLAVLTALQLAGAFVGPFADAVADPDSVVAVLRTALTAAGQLTLPVVLGLFPDGRWHPRWFRWAWPAIGVPSAALVIADQLGVMAAADIQGAFDALTGVLLVGIQVHRYVVVSDWTARQQAKWFVVGFAVLAGNVLASVILTVAGVEAYWQLGLVLTAYAAFVVVILGLGFALLRYRLYDVGVVLRRTAIYVGAVVLLLAAYAGLVALASLTLARSSASVVGAAAVAALAVGVGLLATRAGRWFRDRLLGASGRPGGVAAALAHGIAGPPVNLAETIGVALALPYVALVDADDQPLWTYGGPTGTSHRESVVDGSGDLIGALLLGDDLSRRHRRALREVLPFVVLVLRAEREATELRTARTVATTAREDERRRLRRDLHDGVGPLLAAQLLTLDSLRLATDREGLMAHLEDQARTAIGEVRRISRDLRPAALDTGAGLAPALELEVQRLRTAGFDVRLHCSLGDVEPSAAIEVVVLRIVAEALTNVVRHAAATAATVDVRTVDGVVAVSVVDNGAGFGDDAEPGVGTESMRIRAEELGGSLEITSGPAGTRVEGRIPL